REVRPDVLQLVVHVPARPCAQLRHRGSGAGPELCAVERPGVRPPVPAQLRDGIHPVVQHHSVHAVQFGPDHHNCGLPEEHLCDVSGHVHWR
ncbi:hypothetical protein KR067_006712, partial [Drosophila pandora]